jgi:cytolysin (calcineurin-like family phosphatase)
MKIDWAALGEVVLVSFGAAVGVIVIFAFGVSALAAPAVDPASASDTGQRVTPRAAATQPLAVLCFLACALVVVYSLYLIIVR